MKRIAIFASGSGTNFEALIENCENGNINAKVLLMVCDKKDAYVITRAKNHNVEALVFNPKDYKSKDEYEKMIVNKLNQLNIYYLLKYYP